MGLLIRLKSSVEDGGTALKSLKYGNDRPGGGDSGQPYIKSPIDQPSSISDEDTILRGGLKAPSSALEDVSRLTKYFFDKKNPDGLLFVAKQNVLSRISSKTEASFGLAYGGLSQNINLATGTTSPNQSNGFFNAGIYTPLSTLAQAGVGFTGTHLDKQGIDPTGLIPSLDINKYQDIAYKNNLPENNAYSGEVPLSLVRKSQRASDKAGRKLLARNKQLEKTANTVSSNPERTEVFTRAITPLSNLSNVTFAGINLGGLGAVGIKGSTALEQQRTEFFEKWDRYVDNASQRKFNRKDNASEKAFTRQTDLYNQVLKEESKVKYNNRLLQLWNDSGLNLNSAFSSTSPVLYSYGGGPDSILGIGKTNIKFATTNDGVTPSRTNSIFANNQFSFGSTRPEVKYSTINIFGDENSSVSLRWASLFPTSEEILFGKKDFLEINNNTILDRLGLPTNFATYSGERLKSQGIQVSPYSTWGQTEFQDTLNYQGQNTTNIDDFRTVLASSYANTFLGTPYTQTNNIETLFNLGNPGQRGDLSNGHTVGKIINNKVSITDGITYSPIYKTEVTNGYSQDPQFNDIIPFVIGILNNENQDNTAYVKYMHFRAFIDSFSDGYSADWKGIEYMGRAETFYKYKGFKRDIQVAFTIVAQSRQEQTIMYDKLNFLASSLAPEYLRNGYMAGNLSYLTVGDYLSDQPGIINSLDYDISDDSPWETARDENGELVVANDVRRLPFIIKVKMKFTPIHKFRVEKEKWENDTDNKGKLIPGSTKLIRLGGQRYLDQTRPEYDTSSPSTNNLTPLEDIENENIITIEIPEEQTNIIDIIPEYLEGFGPTI